MLPLTLKGRVGAIITILFSEIMCPVQGHSWPVRIWSPELWLKQHHHHPTCFQTAHCVLLLPTECPLRWLMTQFLLYSCLYPNVLFLIGNTDGEAGKKTYDGLCADGAMLGDLQSLRPSCLGQGGSRQASAANALCLFAWLGFLSWTPPIWRRPTGCALCTAVCGPCGWALLTALQSGLCLGSGSELLRPFISILWVTPELPLSY